VRKTSLERFSSLWGFGASPAEPNKPFERTNCITPKAIPNPAAPKPQCQPMVSPI